MVTSSPQVISPLSESENGSIDPSKERIINSAMFGGFPLHATKPDYVPLTVIYLPPILLEDLSSVHHLLTQDPSAPTLPAELAAIETFASIFWGRRIWEHHRDLARRKLGRTLLSNEEAAKAWMMEHWLDCVYRRKGLELFESVVQRVRAVDYEVAGILESCKGDWMERFRECRQAREGEVVRCGRGEGCG